MKILPVFLKKRATVEMPIAAYNCERIILSRLECEGPVMDDVDSCTIYFNGTPVKYVRKTHGGKSAFFVEGIPGNIKSFHLLGPCKVRFMIDYNNKSGASPESEVRFSLQLSLEINTSLRNVS